MDWTRGRNIVFSSAAPSVNELRGPCDVANLLSLLGLSKERAKAAISKNCRYGKLLKFFIMCLVFRDKCLTYVEYHSEWFALCRILLTNALRKKHFYKEAIRVEPLSSNAASNSKEGQYEELLKWDPISSEGDILLDDLAKCFSSSCRASKTAKAIDFASVVDSIPSHGFQVKDFLPATNAFPVFPDNKGNSLPVDEKVSQSTPVLNNSTEQPNSHDVCPEKDESAVSDAIATHQVVTTTTMTATTIKSFPIKFNQLHESSDTLMSCDKFCEKNRQSVTTETFNSNEEMDTPTNATELELKDSVDLDTDCTPLEAKAHDSQSELCIFSNELDTVIPYENEKLQKSSDDAKLDDAHKIDHRVEIFTPSMHTISPALVHDEYNSEQSSDLNLNAKVTKMHEGPPSEDLKIAEHAVSEINASISENLMEDEQSDKLETDEVELDDMPRQTPYDEMKMEDDSAVATHILPDVTMEDQNLGEVSIESDQVASVHSVSGTPFDDKYLYFYIASYMLFFPHSIPEVHIV